MNHITVLMIGVCRPNSDRIINNIKNNIEYFKLNYSKKYSFSFIISTYKNSFSDKVSEYCIKNNLKFVLMEPIEDYIKSRFYSKLIDNINILNTNTHRLVISMRNILNHINKSTDIVIRLRLDTELNYLEIINPIDYNTYYSSPCWGGITDNIGYSNYNTFLIVWNIYNIFVERNLGKNNETILKSWCENNKIKINYFNYKYILHQSNDESFDDVPQWSKRTRTFEYYNGKYSF